MAQEWEPTELIQTWEAFDAAFGPEIAALEERDHWWYVKGETVIN